MRIVGIVALILGGLLLALYPFVLLADVMGLGNMKPGSPLTLEAATILCFYYGTLAYPIVYIPCLIVAMIARAKSKDVAAFVFSILPLAFLIVIVGIPTVYAWMTGEFKH